MTDEAKEARKAYYKEYRTRNRDRIKQWQTDYWERKAAKYIAEDAAEAVKRKESDNT